MDSTASIPSTQTAAILKTSGPQPVFETAQVPVPSIGAIEILVRLTATGVCGSDYGLACGHFGPTKSILGHEGVGRIARLGDSVPEASFRVGQRVGLAWIREICGECIACRSDGGETRCRAQIQSGRHVDGTFQQYAVVPMKYVISVPEDIPDELVAPILCGGVTAYKALKSSGVVPGQWIVVSGAGGGVGNLAVMFAKAMGYRVVAVDFGSAKEKVCLDAGAEAYVDVAAADDLSLKVHSLTDGGASAVVVTAGAQAAYQSAVGLLAPLGTLVCVGIPGVGKDMTIHPIELIDKGIRLVGSAVGTRKDISEALSFVSRGVVVPNIEKATLDDLNDISAKLGSGDALSKYVIQL
ncbi:related to ALCOHOL DEHYDROGENASE I - ADH1 [Cephalotrichum gorgonifer]|uniref:alcohol dehydrogenase n=1 Tax=Cephalotrichum gorgonifer TaxID=2041049 RepID=A0AAE8N4Y0_9PEZI|nr:related to ALCOHOL DEHYDROGENASE I - ADH1 [Cephalotrichum gorgonifer]